MAPVCYNARMSRNFFISAESASPGSSDVLFTRGVDSLEEALKLANQFVVNAEADVARVLTGDTLLEVATFPGGTASSRAQSTRPS